MYSISEVKELLQKLNTSCEPIVKIDSTGIILMYNCEDSSFRFLFNFDIDEYTELPSNELQLYAYKQYEDSHFEAICDSHIDMTELSELMSLEYIREFYKQWIYRYVKTDEEEAKYLLELSYISLEDYKKALKKKITYSNRGLSVIDESENDNKFVFEFDENTSFNKIKELVEKCKENSDKVVYSNVSNSAIYVKFLRNNESIYYFIVFIDISENEEYGSFFITSEHKYWSKNFDISKLKEIIPMKYIQELFDSFIVLNEIKDNLDLMAKLISLNYITKDNIKGIVSMKLNIDNNPYDLDPDYIYERNESEKYAGGEIMEFMKRIPNWQYSDMKISHDGTNIFIFEKKNDFGLNRNNLKKYLKEQYGDKIRFYRIGPKFEHDENQLAVGFNLKNIITEALVQTDQTNPNLELPDDINLLSLFRGALADEQSATTLYDRIIIIVEKMNIPEDLKKKIVDVITEIRNDEKNHTGKLLYLIKLLDVAYKFIEKGMNNEEVEQSDSENDENKEDSDNSDK